MILYLASIGNLVHSTTIRILFQVWALKSWLEVPSRMSKGRLLNALTRERVVRCTVVRSTRTQGSQMVRVSRSTRMAQFTKGTSMRANAMALAVVWPLKVKSFKVRSPMIRWTAMATSNGLTDPCTKVSGEMARRMEKASSTGIMGSYMKVNSRTMSAMDLACCIIHAERSSKECGRMARRTVGAFTHGLMEHSIMSFTLTGRSKAKECLKIAWCLSTTSGRPISHYRKRAWQQKNFWRTPRCLYIEI